ncbi:MAG: bifunctional folylpolyglutamate synthase/dihydrofolate synthase [Ignavibacteriaceae bacterium]|nr:bifunctional folylpolyglutamate synthase/dihydrofolate synthase [Ignavibacteriaceae bacterium]
MDLQKSLDKLYSLHTFGVKLGLENIKSFLAVLGNPENKIRTIHIAGSNGKGSTAAFIASILQEMKFKVGLYTSPHFVKFNERIKVNGKEILDERIANFIHDHESEIDTLKLTFFEVTTALAFQYFYEEKVDYAVIETGLGGRLDATNTVKPVATVITSISLEHMDILGDTIEKIAEEKAGIIKEGVKVFIGIMPEPAEEVIEKKCQALQCELFDLKEYIVEKENSLELYTEELELDEWIMPLKGKYQKYNAALASLVVSKCLDNDNFRVIEHGIKNVVKNTGLQGRFEYIHYKPDIILDSAHNPEGIENFINEFNKVRKNYSHSIVLFGVMKDKAIKEMLNLLKGNFDEFLITEIDYDRACPISSLSNIASEINLIVKPETKPGEYVANFRYQTPSKCLVVLGSMYLLGTVKAYLEGMKTS